MSLLPPKEELKFLLFILNLSVNDNSFEGSMLSGHLQCTSSCNLPSTTDRLKDEIGPPMVSQSAKCEISTCGAIGFGDWVWCFQYRLGYFVERECSDNPLITHEISCHIKCLVCTIIIVVIIFCLRWLAYCRNYEPTNNSGDHLNQSLIPTFCC